MSIDPGKLLDECKVSYFLSSGPGGQRRDRKRTAVRLVHLPTGIVVVSGRRRSRIENLQDALERLGSRIEEKSKVRKPRIKTKVPSHVKEKILREKKRRSMKKKLRRRISPDEE
ncbi:MAG: peptide chain release factor-like protein [Candidatus Glassbacteria bacterium]